MYGRNLINKVSNKIRDKYTFDLVRFTISHISYLTVAHGDYDDLIKICDGYQVVESFPFAAPPEWANDIAKKIEEDLYTLQISVKKSETARSIYPITHQDEIFDIMKEHIFSFNTSYLIINNE